MNNDDLVEMQFPNPWRRWRTLVAGLAIAVVIALYAWAASSFGIWISQTSVGSSIWLMSLVYFLVGLLWLLPVIFIIRWGARDPGNELSNETVAQRLRDQ